MSKNQQLKYQTVIEFIEGKLTRQQTAGLLHVHEKTISRLANKIRKKGYLGLAHENLGRKPTNRTPDGFSDMVMDLVEKRYFDFNMTHALELLKQEQGIEVKYETFRRWCHKKHFVKRRKRRKAKARHSRVRMPNEGLLLQFDDSHHPWNGKDEWCLIAAIDDATSDIPYAEFFLGEDTINCMVVMQKIIQLKGIPHAIYVDCAGWFGGTKRQEFAQFKRACEELNIRVIFASSPEAKGRIERTWDTIQDRLVPEMRLRNIHRIPAANYYLQTQFLPNYWKPRNTVVPKNLETRYTPLPKDVDLSQIFCIKDYRAVKRNHTLSWNKVIYQLKSPLKHSIRGQKIEIRTYQDLTWKAYFANLPIELFPVESTVKAHLWNDKVA